MHEYQGFDFDQVLPLGGQAYSMLSTSPHLADILQMGFRRRIAAQI